METWQSDTTSDQTEATLTEHKTIIAAILNDGDAKVYLLTQIPQPLPSQKQESVTSNQIHKNLF